MFSENRCVFWKQQYIQILTTIKVSCENYSTFYKEKCIVWEHFYILKKKMFKMLTPIFWYIQFNVRVWSRINIVLLFLCLHRLRRTSVAFHPSTITKAVIAKDIPVVAYLRIPTRNVYDAGTPCSRVSTCPQQHDHSIFDEMLDTKLAHLCLTLWISSSQPQSHTLSSPLFFLAHLPLLARLSSAPIRVSLLVFSRRYFTGKVAVSHASLSSPLIFD